MCQYLNKMLETDYKKQIELRKKTGFVPISAIIVNNRITHIDYIPIKLLEKLKEQ